MPLFRVQVHYTRGLLDKWSNVWHVNAASLLSASVEFKITGIVHLLPLLHPSCQINRLLVSDPLSSAFIVNPVNEDGLSGDVSSLLPLYNTAKALFPTPGFGRPDYKYLKGFVTESNSESGLLTGGTQTNIDSNLTAFIAAMTGVGVVPCSNEGDNYTTCTVQAAVQMRQMHRKRKKKVVVV